ncbi:MAG: M20 family metallopeptidase [Actinomycetota bacterium]|nr:M20 family metallopeptidase [Actinomycetota bacterium]
MDTKQRAQDKFSSHEAELRELSRWMYDNPEVGYEEFMTSRRYVDMLSTNGFDVEYPVYGLDTAFAARIGSSGPEVVICAEMDALPEVGHACGHNIIGAAALGAGLALAPLVNDLGIRLTVLGTPAEEALGGKVDLIKAGAFEGVAAAMMVHPATKDIVDPEFLAVRHVDVEFAGRESHAAASPDLGINALDAAVQAYVNVALLRQQLKDSDRVHGIITHGGAAPNIIPGYTAMSWYIRAATDERLNEIYPKVLRCFEAAALATGCGFEVRQMGHRYRDLRSNPLLVDLYQENSERAGRSMHRLADLPPETSGSTDMGNVSYEVPSIHPMLDLHCYPIVNHQKEFAAHTLSDDGEQAIRDGALAMAWTVIDLAEGDRWDELQAH